MLQKIIKWSKKQLIAQSSYIYKWKLVSQLEIDGVQQGYGQGEPGWQVHYLLKLYSSDPMCIDKMNRVRVRVQEAISYMETEGSHELHNCYQNCGLKKNPTEQTYMFDIYILM